MVVRPKRKNLGSGDRATVPPVGIAQSQIPAESFANPLIRNILSRQPHRYARGWPVAAAGDNRVNRTLIVCDWRPLARLPPALRFSGRKDPRIDQAAAANLMTPAPVIAPPL